MAVTLDFLFHHPQHISELAQWMYEEWGNFYPDASLETANKWLEKTKRLSGLPITMLALEGHTLAGFAMLQRQELYREKGMTPWLGGLLVKERYKNLGVGRRLQDWVVTYARSLAYQKLYLLAFDFKITQWYQKSGWAIIKTVDKENTRMYIMERQL